MSNNAHSKDSTFRSNLNQYNRGEYDATSIQGDLSKGGSGKGSVDQLLNAPIIKKEIVPEKTLIKQHNLGQGEDFPGLEQLEKDPNREKQLNAAKNVQKPIGGMNRGVYGDKAMPNY
eukprot:403342258